LKNLFDLLKRDWQATLFVFAVVVGLAISYSALYLFHIVLGLVIVKLFYDSVIRKKLSVPLRLLSSYHLFYVFFFVWFAISILWAENTILAFKYLFYIFCGASISLYYIYYSKDISKLKLLFSLTSIIVIFEMLLSILEVTTDFRLPISRHSFLLPFFGRDVFLTPEILLRNDNSYIFSMPTGFHWNPNSLSALLCIAFPFFLGNSKKLISFLGSIVILFLVVSAGARISFWTLFIVFIIFFFVYSRKKSVINYIILCCFAFIISDGFYIFPTQSKKVYELSLISNSDFNKELITDNSKSSRKELLKKGLSMFYEAPIVGYGGNGARVNLNKEKELEYKDLHFFWLELLVNGGLVFFIVAGIWYFKILHKNFSISLKSNNRDLKYFSQSVFLALVGFVFTVIGPGSVIYFFPMYILLGFSVAIINIYLLEEFDIKQ